MKKDRELLLDANSIIRSFKSVIDRQGKETNWEGLDIQVSRILKEQHEVLFPSFESSDKNEPAIHYYKCPECGKFIASNGMAESWLEEQLKNIQIHLHPKMEIPCRGEYIEITKEDFWKLAEDPKSYNKCGKSQQ